MVAVGVVLAVGVLLLAWATRPVDRPASRGNGDAGGKPAVKRVPAAPPSATTAATTVAHVRVRRPALDSDLVPLQQRPFEGMSRDAWRRHFDAEERRYHAELAHARRVIARAVEGDDGEVGEVGEVELRKALVIERDLQAKLDIIAEQRKAVETAR